MGRAPVTTWPSRRAARLGTPSFKAEQLLQKGSREPEPEGIPLSQAPGWRCRGLKELGVDVHVTASDGPEHRGQARGTQIGAPQAPSTEVLARGACRARQHWVTSASSGASDLMTAIQRRPKNYLRTIKVKV